MYRIVKEGKSYYTYYGTNNESQGRFRSRGAAHEKAKQDGAGKYVTGLKPLRRKTTIRKRKR